ncbi:MAG: ferrochelatase [Coriobacteriales bacterium]
MKCGVMLINTGVPESDSAGALHGYAETVLGGNLYTEGLGIMQRQMFRRITIPAKARAWRRYFHGDGDVTSSYLTLAESLRSKLATKLTSATRTPCVVVTAMRCGTPSLEDAAGQLAEEGCDIVFLLPLYPLRFPPVTVAALEGARAAIERVGAGAWEPRLVEIDSFCKTPGFAQALAQRIERDWEPRNVSRLLILMPSEPRALAQADTVYEEQIEWLTQRLCQLLKISPGLVHVAFVCDYDNAHWLGPFAEKTLMGWVAGVRDVKAICPAFCMPDALGSYDAGSRMEEFFRANVMGKPPSYDFVAPLGDSDELVDVLCDVVTKALRRG